MPSFSNYNKFSPLNYNKFGNIRTNVIDIIQQNINPPVLVPQPYTPTYILNIETINQALEQEYSMNAEGEEVFVGYVDPSVQVADESITLLSSDTQTFKANQEIVFEVSDWNEDLDEVQQPIQQRTIEIEPVIVEKNEILNPVLENLYERSSKGYSDVSVDDEKVKYIMEQYRSKLKNPLDKNKLIKSTEKEEVFKKPKSPSFTSGYFKKSRW